MSTIQEEATKERLLSEFDTVVVQTEQLLKSVAGAGTDQAVELQARVEKSFADAFDRLSKLREDALSKAGAAAQATDEFVQDNPWRAVAIVAAATALTGFIAGLLVARK